MNFVLYKDMWTATVLLLITQFASADANLKLRRAVQGDISKVAPRLLFKTDSGMDSTCTGFFISPKAKASRTSKNNYFVTAAHCHLNSELQPMHKKFILEDRMKKLNLKGSMANACHDLLAKRVSRSTIGRSKVHGVAEMLPEIGGKLSTFGYPVQIVGDRAKIGMKMECSYEGVTQSESSSGWQANLFQHQMVCNFPYAQNDPSLSLGGMSGGPVFDDQGKVVGVISQQRIHCPEYAKDGCSKARLLFTEVHSGLFDKHGRMTTQRSKSRYTYQQYLPWEGKKPVDQVDVDFDYYGCIQGMVRSTKSPSFHGRKGKIDFSGIVPRL